MADNTASTTSYATSSTQRANPTTAPRSWLEFEHPEYTKLKNQWEYAMDHYTGDVLLTRKLEFYLRQRAQGESNQAYQERASLSDYTNHFAAIVDSTIGMAMSVEANANRVFGTDKEPGLGDPTDLATPIGKLYVRCDDEGNSYETVHRQLGMYFTVMHRSWGLVDAGPDDETRLRYLDPRMVTNWWINPATRLLEAVLLRESCDERPGIKTNPAQGAAETRYVLFELDGWTRWYTNKKGDALQVKGAAGKGTYHYESFDRTPVLPIYPCRLSLRRHVGWLLAKKCNAIYNAESARDHLIRVANFPRLNVFGPSEHFNKIEKDLAKGVNMLHNLPSQQGKGHDYIAPPTQNAEIATKVLERKVEELWITGFREYSQAAQQRTATEVRQDLAMGVGAFLQLFKSSMDEAENNALWRIAQREFPDQPAVWFLPRVQRSDDFNPMNPETIITNIVQRSWGTNIQKSVPLDADALYAAAKEVAQHMALPIDPYRLKAAVRVRMFQDQQQTGVTMPASVRAEYTVDCAIAQGRVVEGEMIEVEDTQGAKSKILKIDKLRQDALALAQQDDLRTSLEAQHSVFPAAEKQLAGIKSDHNQNGVVGA